jgi:hypothetical protein
MKRFCVSILVGILMMAGRPVWAAPVSSDTAGTVAQFMQKVQQAYKNASYLSFNLLYRYANKNEPARYIDTMSGEIAMDRNRMRLVIDDVETITTAQYTIQVMKEDKLIYLSTPKPAMGTDPLNMLDTVLAHMDGVQTQIAHSKGIATLNISFPPGQMYKTISMTVNESTGFFEKVAYELFTEGLLSADQIAQAGKPGTYQAEGRVEVLFSNYQQGRFNDSVFNEGIYFTRLGKGDYEPTEQYKDYQIFLASSNL